VHIPRFAANESLVNLNTASGTAHLAAAMAGVLHRQPEPVKHEPRRFLCHADGLGDLVAGDAILAVEQHPVGNHPFSDVERRILKDRPYLDRELRLAAFAKPEPPRLDEAVFFRSATRAGDAFGPAQLDGVGQSIVGIGEHDHRLLQRFRGFCRVHEHRLPVVGQCVKYIFTPGRPRGARNCAKLPDRVGVP